ncbi:hypothetical protein FHR99_002996 [Litorivivens lipolytica]|uniref:Uncharacterized protein n=1 Tax=Litorivivens lipolytica TaxID=1524264 RepID=A0A7W4Z6Y6_9GAMM|nr:hypothetical protein [Litorivivens lipolytica]MBB3048722.1 hypothetical protein [Litorivivens lipolytica]
MVSLSFRRVFPHLVTLLLTLSPGLSYSEPSQNDVGVLVQFNWNIGHVHSEQSRWQTNFAMGSTGNIVRSINETASINRSLDDSFEFKYLDQKISLLPLQWSMDSIGNSFSMLYGVPVVSKLSPVFNASSNNESGDTIVSNPWVWAGALVLGAAAASGGDGGGSSTGDTEEGARRVEIVCGNNDFVLGNECVANQPIE